MGKINRIEIDEFWADSTIVEAGNYIYTAVIAENIKISLYQEKTFRRFWKQDLLRLPAATSRPLA